MLVQVGVKALIRRDGRYLLLRKSADFGNGSQEWDIPGGRIEPDESLELGLAREVAEETGLKLKSNKVLLAAQDIFVEKKNLHVVRLTYLAEVEGAELALSDEHDELRWMTQEQLLAENQVDKYLKEVLQTVWEK